MDFLTAVILGVVEGITEFLPVSSTGHLVLVSNLLGLPQSSFNKSFEIAIQSGAILAVIALYFKKVLKNLKLIKPIIIAFIPTGILGLFFYKLVKDVLLENILITVIALFVGGVAIIFLERYFKGQEGKKEIENLTFFESLAIGAVQALAFIPGVSRAAATIFGGMFAGLSRAQAVEFSFLLAVPTMFAATSYDLVKNAGSFARGDFGVLAVGFVTSFVVALVAVRWLVSYAQKYSFAPFGWYRIAISALYFLLLQF